jgi:hypothetical protein
MFVEGAFSPLDDLLDIAVAWMLIRLLGWHWAFLPSFVAKVVPGLDLVPTWTMAEPTAENRGALRDLLKPEATKSQYVYAACANAWPCSTLCAGAG